MSHPADPNEAALIECSAVRLLGGREHSRAELRRKLRHRFGDVALIDTVLDRLQGQGLLSEQRFAESYIAQRCRKGFGPLRIRAELRERSVSGELIATCLDQADIDWHAMLTRAANSRFGTEPVADRRALAKRARFLEQRGFPPGLIGQYLDHVRSP